MDILQFIGGLEALPRDKAHYARKKSKLAELFGLENPPTVFPADVDQTRIPDRAMDGYMARHILSDKRIEGDTFADYAFTASAIFAAQQIALRSGMFTRGLNVEYPYFLFPSIDPYLWRIADALTITPLSFNWWSKTEKTEQQQSRLVLILSILERRAVKAFTLEQIFNFFECSENEPEVKEIRARLAPVFTPPPTGKIGLLVMAKFGTLADYILAFDRLAHRLSELSTVLIYDKSSVVTACCAELSSRRAWRGMVFKQLAYQTELHPDDYALLALQSDFAPS